MKTIGKTLNSAGVTINKGLQLVEVSLEQSLQEVINEAMSEISNLDFCKGQRPVFISPLTPRI